MPGSRDDAADTGTRIPPVTPGQCPCCGYSGRADRPPCTNRPALYRRCRAANCPRGGTCPGPLGRSQPVPPPRTPAGRRD